MEQHTAVFVGLDVAKARHAVAVAEDGRRGEVRYLGEVGADAESIRRLVAKLEKRHGCDLRSREASTAQPRMLFASRDPVRSARTMAALDSVNARYGRDALRIAATGLERGRGTRHNRLSPRYTTRAEDRLTPERALSEAA